MIVGYHIILGTYGFWLPNDPRGSWSDFVGALELFRSGGRATKTNTRRSVASAAHDHQQRMNTKNALRYPPVKLNGTQAQSVAHGFTKYFAQSVAPAWACAILPDHVHLIVGRGRLDAEKLSIALKSAATRALKEDGMHPQQAFAQPNGSVPKCFAENLWKVFLDPEDVPRAIRYVEENPLKDGLRAQRWSFVVPSPYAHANRGTRSAPQTPPRG